MLPSAEKLRKALQAWLSANDLDGDLHFYSRAEWAARKEEFGLDAHLCMTFEGGLWSLLNGYTYDERLHTEFADLAASLGYWHEMLHHWSLGFYPIDGYDFVAPKGSYSDQLRDARWVKKRNKVRERAGNACEDCRTASPPLEVHHCYYMFGFAPWEYPYDSLRCLCRPCHKERAKEEMRARGLMAKLTTAELKRIPRALEHASHWFERDAVLKFLEELGPTDAGNGAAFGRLFNRKNPPD